MADAEPQAPEIRATVRDRVAQPVVAAVAAAELEPRDARRKIELVVHDQHFRERRLHVVHQRADRESAAVHVRLRLEQRQLAPLDLHAGDLAVVTRMRAEFGALGARERVHEPEPRVVPREPVLGPGVAESDDDLQRCASHW